ncbi:hypothetical protein [Spirillospora sp. CA-294931]|uniref:hypothetical protein n=1 Tax=Spirillospora sp. CA-294931 TaxID=3240042 RepID=UPI003D8EDF55
MDRDERDGRRLLAPLKGAEPGAPDGVDIARAMRGGRRRVRTRRLAGVGAASAAVAAVALVSALVGSAPERDPGPMASRAQFDPMRQSFTVGSAGGFTPDTYETGRFRQRVTLRVADPASPRRADGVVTMYPRGALTGADGRRWKPEGERAPDVLDRPAYWLDRSQTRPSALELAWQWTPGAWAFASVKGDGVDRETAHRVAQSVWPGNAAVTAPVTASVGPRRLLGTLSRVAAADARPMVGLLYGLVDAPARLPARDVSWIAVGAEDLPPDTATTTTVGGKSAVERTNKVLIPGARAAVFAESGGPAPLDGARLRTLAASVRMLPGVPWPPAVPTPRPTR